MEVWEATQTALALILAMTAALMSGDPEARQEVSSYVAAAMAPPSADYGIGLGLD